MSTIISWNLQVSIHDGRFDEFKSLMQEMVESTQKETGTLAYEWFLSEDSKSCHVYERYSDSDAVNPRTLHGRRSRVSARSFLIHSAGLAADIANWMRIGV